MTIGASPAACPHCGTPGPYGPDCPAGRHRPRGRRRIRIAAAAAVVIAVLAGGAAVLLLRPAPGPAVVAEVRVPASPTPAPAPADPLDQVVADGAATAESLVGRWVPQVSSATGPGALADVRFWQERYPDAVVVRSADFSSFQLPGYWVTLVPPGYATAAEAVAWCDAEGLAPDDCLAKRLSRTDAPPGNTVRRTDG